MGTLNRILKIKLDGKIFELMPRQARLFDKILKERGKEVAERLCRIKFGLMPPVVPAEPVKKKKIINDTLPLL